MAEHHRLGERDRGPPAGKPAHDPDVVLVRDAAADPARLRHRPHDPSARRRLGRDVRALPAAPLRAADLRDGHRPRPDLLRLRGALHGLCGRTADDAALGRSEGRRRLPGLLGGEERGHARRQADRHAGVTPEAALDALRAHADPDRAAQMRAYHKADRDYLGLSNAVTGALADEWRKSSDPDTLAALARGLWASDVFEARIAAGKLFIQARIRPDDDWAWEVIEDFVPDFDSWAIADAVAQSGQKRLVQKPARLDILDAWVGSDHLWTRRAALTFTLLFARSRHPGPDERAARARVLGWCETLALDREWFLQKAVAWWLRDLSKRDPETVAAFLAGPGMALKPWARKEAARHLP
ncbi:hypothetical protein HKCCE3408_17610 [Rhodobacterales bacterium HKCCE3408]|nr:hypothetical protein [Rhodobacterales bacterium HKCCE3408]